MRVHRGVLIYKDCILFNFQKRKSDSVSAEMVMTEARATLTAVSNAVVTAVPSEDTRLTDCTAVELADQLQGMKLRLSIFLYLY